ncbi:MAG: acetyl-CoA decarbonylase/synthase complex subunit delta [Candidatus Omnitrophota bacterium]
MERMIEKWQDKITEVVIGSKKPARIGGETGVFFIQGEDAAPNPPIVAMDVWDTEPDNWPGPLKAAYGKSLKEPVEWAKMCVERFSADAICLRLSDQAQTAEKTLEKILKEISVPLIVIGASPEKEKDNELMIRCTEAAKGENCLFGIATQDNYKTLTASCLSTGHSIIAEAPIDINIAKQLNILICDMGFPQNKIIIHHATGALGYGLEYTYSIMERTRLAGLSGDKMLSMPMISFVGQETWRTKEARTGDNDGLLETATAGAYLNSGADILVMNHPKAVTAIKKTIKELCS